jgi:phosphoribosylformylglycinamidine synthase
VGGEIEFDASFADYCLVDVCSIGIGPRRSIIQNAARCGDIIFLVGGATGRDGIHGAAFASRKYERKERSAVQIPDPFTEKMLIEAIVEGIDGGIIKALKDLGGGGLSCCLSEMSDSLGLGFDIELDQIHLKEDGMSPIDIMISESQERMVVVVDPIHKNNISQIFRKYDVQFAVLGKVERHQSLVIKNKKKIIANLPSHLVANAPLAKRKSKKPAYLTDLNRCKVPNLVPLNLKDTLFSLLSDPSIASKKWIYSQYDFEVGLRTRVQPGIADASVLRLDNDNYLSVKLDGNSKHCYIDPYHGTLGCLSEACRNIVCTGAAPVGIVDHLQFGNPEKPEVFWSFRKAVNAIIEFCEFNGIPVVGGKVSFYNETIRAPIKPTPVIGAFGLIQRGQSILEARLREGDTIFVVGETSDELGGSEYYESAHRFTGGNVPVVNMMADQVNRNTVLNLINKTKLSCVHDCSKGGLATAISEMGIFGKVGFELFVDKIPNLCAALEGVLFSESHSRFLIGTQRPEEVENYLSEVNGLVYSRIGRALDKRVSFWDGKTCLMDTDINVLISRYNAIERIMTHGQDI